MEQAQVRQKLSEIMQDVFDDPSIQAKDELTASDIDGWDSLSHINFIVAVEKSFRVKLTTAEVRSLNDVGGFIRLLAQKAA